MSATTGKKKSVSFWINTAITLILMAGFGFLEPFGQITPMGMKVLGVFLGMLWGWITVELIWPSIIGMVFFAFSGYTTINGVFGSCFDANVMQAFMCFLVAGLFDCFGVTNYLASKIMSNKMMIGKPWMIALFIFIAVAVISILSSTTAAIFLMWAVVGRVADSVGCAKNDRFIGWIIAGIVYVGFNTSMILPFKATTITYMSFITGVMDIQIPFGPYVLVMFLINVCILALYFAFGKFILRLDVSAFQGEADHFAYMRGAKATKNQKIGLVFIGVFIAVLMWPSIFPKTWLITQLFQQLGLIGVIAVLITVGAILKDEEGKAIAPISKLMKSVGWDIVWLLAATFPVAAAMRSADCGIMATINAFVRPLVGDMGPYALIIVFMIVLGIITQFTHNVVLAAMFLPFLCPLVAGMGGNPIVCWLCIYLMLQSAYATPAASMPAAFVFGHETMKDTKNGYVLGIGIFIITLLVAICFIPVEIMLF